MSQASRPRRSFLYMPGSNTRALEKGKTLAADGLILDLEDAVAPDAKIAARGHIYDAVSAGGYGHRELLVRVNGLTTPWGTDDLAAAATCGADGILLPKVEDAETVRQADDLLRAAGAPETLGLWCMMETPRGILQAQQIADASPRLVGLVMGTSDLAKDLHCHHTALRLPLITSLGLCLLAARAAGLAIIDGVHLDLDDEDGFAAACRQGLELGFDGKTVIHPKQLATANRVFAPSAADIAWSRRIIEAHAAAEAAGQGVVVVDGKLVENLHVASAHSLLALATRIAETEETNP